MSAIEHPSDEMLAALWSEDLPAAGTERILAHLECCPTCEQRLNQIDPTIRQYRRFVQIVDAHLPDPQRAWPDIWSEMERADRRKSPVVIKPSTLRPMRALYLGAVAAAILLVLFTWPRNMPVVRAETLLGRAQAASSHSPSRARLRIGTRKTSFVRPAVLTGDSPGGELRAQFMAARYDWNDPLSAAAFRGWRKQLRNKSDRVSVSGEPAQYQIETTTQDSTLRDASITFEGPDLTPVSLKLQFADEEWVEITALSAAPEPAASTAGGPAGVHGNTPGSQPVQESPLTDDVTAGRELQVLLAIDALPGDSPAPVTVDVTSEGTIEVTPYHLPPGQERDLRASLSGIEGVVLKPMERDPEPSAEIVSPNDSEPAMGIAGTVASLAHLLASEADRFPASREARLNASGRDALRSMRERHAAQLNREIDRLGRRLAATRPIAGDSEPQEAANRSAPSLAELVQAAGKLNRLVTAIYTVGADHIEAAAAWPEISSEWNRVRRLARAYERSLETSPETLR